MPLWRRGRTRTRCLVVTTTADLPVLPAIVDGFVAHRRRGPVEHAFRHHMHQWLVDLDHIPRQPWYLRPLVGFDARDHLGGGAPGASSDLKVNVRRYLALHGIDLGAGGRVAMLANARILGHVFDPLTVFWCFGGDGALRCVIAEVHNTYGDRHAYLLTPDAGGAAHVDKQLYVSPFNDVSGRYEMQFGIADDEVQVTVALQREGHTVFDATFAGVAIPATARTIVRFALRRPLMAHRVSALIRVHGIWLWIRGLPVVARPTHPHQEGV